MTGKIIIKKTFHCCQVLAQILLLVCTWQLNVIAQLPSNGEKFNFTILPLAGERFKEASFACWLPPTQGSIKGIIIHQHGCGEAASSKSITLIDDIHWRALAEKNECALIVPSYKVNSSCQDWVNPGNGSERALFAALELLASQTQRKEILKVPWVIWGHSGGSSWVAQMILRNRSRIIGATMRGGASAYFGDPAFRDEFVSKASDLPMLFILGKGEASPTSKHHVSWLPMHKAFGELRKKGGLVALAIDPLTEHHCGNSRLLIIPFLDCILSKNLFRKSHRATLVDTVTQQFKPVNSLSIRNAGYVWLPSPLLGKKWVEFSKSGTVKSFPPLLRPPLLAGRMVKDSNLVILNWQIKPELNSGIRAVKIYRNDSLHKEIGVTPNDFIAEHGDTAPKELLVSQWEDDTVQSGKTYSYRVSFTNAAGSTSKLSKAVSIQLP